MSAKLPPDDNKPGGRGSKEPNPPPLNKGFWSKEEEEYVDALISDFKAGRLPLAEGTTLRSFLAKMLNCHPKRISKKFRGTNYNGKQAYERKSSNMTPEQVKARQKELQELEKRFRATSLPSSVASETSSDARAMTQPFGAPQAAGGVSIGHASADYVSRFLLPRTSTVGGLGASLPGLNYPATDFSRLSHLHSLNSSLNRTSSARDPGGTVARAAPAVGEDPSATWQQQQQQEWMIQQLSRQRQTQAVNNLLRGGAGTGASAASFDIANLARSGNPFLQTGGIASDQASMANFLNSQILQHHSTGGSISGMSRGIPDHLTSALHSSLLNPQGSVGASAQSLMDASRLGNLGDLSPARIPAREYMGLVAAAGLPGAQFAAAAQEAKTVDPPSGNLGVATAKRGQPSSSSEESSDFNNEVLAQKKKARKSEE